MSFASPATGIEGIHLPGLHEAAAGAGHINWLGLGVAAVGVAAAIGLARFAWGKTLGK